jgi:hypothetical protein
MKSAKKWRVKTAQRDAAAAERAAAVAAGGAPESMDEKRTREAQQRSEDLSEKAAEEAAELIRRWCWWCDGVCACGWRALYLFDESSHFSIYFTRMHTHTHILIYRLLQALQI